MNDKLKAMLDNTKAKVKAFGEKTKPAREKVGDAVGHAAEWCVDHSGIIWGAIVGAVTLEVHGYMRGRVDGVREEHEKLEQKKDTAYGLALRKAGITDDEAETLSGVGELIDVFGKDEVVAWYKGDLEDALREKEYYED